MTPRLALLLVGSALLACGGAPPAPPVTHARSTGARAASAPDTFAVSGLRGTLSQREIDGALRPKLARMLGCVQQRRAQLDALAGRLVLSFHVATDGRVVAVHPSESSLGDREAERCISAIAAATRFPEPHGGEADFTYPLEVDADDEVRPPVSLPPDRAEATVRSQGAELRARCGGGAMVVTMYVQPDGSVAAAGAAAPDGATEAQLDCLTEGVRGWTLRSPGSYVGKLSVVLP